MVANGGTGVCGDNQYIPANEYANALLPQQPHQDQIQSAALVLPSDPISSISPTIKSTIDHLVVVVAGRRRQKPQKRRNITMAMISAFITVDKMAHNSCYVDGSIPCPSKTLSVTDGATIPKENPNYPIWFSKDAHVYAPHSTSREYTLKTQLLRIEMHGDETPDAYSNCLCDEYNGFKTTITARQSPTAFSELHALLNDHDYILEKTRAPAPSITSSFVANYAVGSPSMPEARQAQLSELTAQLSSLGFQVSPIAPSGPQDFYGARPSYNKRNNNNNNRGNRNNSHGNNNNRGHGNGRQFDWASTQNIVYGTCNRCDNGANSHVTPDLEAMDNSKAYYGDDALHVGNDMGLPILHIGSSKALPSWISLSISSEHLYIARHVHFNEAQFPFDIPKTTSPPTSKTYPYYSSETPYVIPTTNHPSPSSLRLPISSPSSVSH
ncbi:hypothetical protein Tco_0436560 [Tanacetum coccineum]